MSRSLRRHCVTAILGLVVGLSTMWGSNGAWGQETGNMMGGAMGQEMAGGMAGGVVEEKVEAKPESQAKPEVKAKPEAKIVKPAETEDARDGAAQVTGDVTFFASRTVVGVNDTAVIPWSMAAADVDRVLTGVVEQATGDTGNAKGADGDDGVVLSIVRPAEILAGQTIGFVRVRGHKAGTATLTVGGGAKITVQVGARFDDAYRREQAMPKIVSPVSGAVVWGEVYVGVEMFDDPLRWGDGDSNGDETRDVRLNAPTGVVVRRLDDESHVRGPHRYATFAIDVRGCDAGAIELVPVLKSVAGDVMGDAVTLHVLEESMATGESLMVGEAEIQPAYEWKPTEDELADGVKPRIRPRRYGQNALPVRESEAASGGKFLENNASRPPLMIPLTTEDAGWYQLVITASADMGGSAWPTVQFRVGNRDRDESETAARVMSQGWGRWAIGNPVKIKAGEHQIAVLFANDYHRGKNNDRNLRIDRYELLRLDQAPARTVALTRAVDRRDLAVAFSEVWDGRVVAGDVRLEGWVNWEQSMSVKPPVVRLLVNGEVVGEQCSARPDFYVSRGQWHKGENRIELVAALTNGRQASSGEQVVRVTDYPVEVAARRSMRFHVSEPAWIEGIGPYGKLSNEKRSGGERSKVFFSNGRAALALPEDLAGEFDVYFVGRGDEFDGRPEAEIHLQKPVRMQAIRVATTQPATTQPATTQPARRDGDSDTYVAGENVGGENVGGGNVLIGTVKPHGGWATHRAGRVTLDKGAKLLSVAFVNDKYDDKLKKDRNLWLYALELIEVPDEGHADKKSEDGATDKAKAMLPVARVLYPASGAVVDGTDGVIVELAGHSKINRVELVVDDKPTGVVAFTSKGDGRVLLPLLTRALAPGSHTLRVIAHDASTKAKGESETLHFVVGGGGTVSDGNGESAKSQTASGKLGRYARAVRLLDRFGFGPDERAMIDVLLMGEQAYLETKLNEAWGEGSDGSAWARVYSEFTNNASGGHVKRRPIAQLLMSDNPVRGRLRMFLDNHFTTWMRKARALRKARDHRLWSELGASPMQTLLLASAQSPAMLVYLDQQKSVRKRINENYAREIMELHSLGVHGGYTQDDVTQLAHLLTGWGVADEGPMTGKEGNEIDSFYRYDASQNDKSERVVFGLRVPESADEAGRYDRVRLVIEMLASHPSTARFMANKLAEHYVTAPAPKKLVDDLVAVYHQSGGDMSAMLLAISQHDEFWRTDLPMRLTHPLDHGLRLARVCEYRADGQINTLLQRCGVGLFDRDTPDGYPEEDMAYVDSNMMVQRWRFAQDIDWALANLWPWTLHKPIGDEDPGVWRQRVVDLLAVRMTGDVLGQRSNAAVLALLEKNEENNVTKRARMLATVIAQMPEANLR